MNSDSLSTLTSKERLSTRPAAPLARLNEKSRAPGTRGNGRTVPSPTTQPPAPQVSTAAAPTEPDPGRLLQLGLGFWASKTLLSAVELGVFTALADKPLTARELGRKLNLHDRGALDFFDALVALKLLDRKGGKYSNTTDAALFLDRNKPSYVGGLLEMSNARLYKSWGFLTEALKTGRCQNESKAGGKATFDALYSDPRRLKLFLQAMTGISLPSARAIATKFDWARYRNFVDIGTAQGCVPVELARAHRHLTGIGFDLKTVEPIFREYVASFKLSHRIKFQSGDMFGAAPLPSADVLIFGHILHDWDLSQKRQLLAKAYSALPKGGAVIVYESLIDDDRSHNAFGLLMSLNMLIETEGGFDYTGADCMKWMREAGFASARVEHLAGPESMVIGIK